VRLLDSNDKVIERSFCGISNDDREAWCSSFDSFGDEQKVDKADLRNFVNMKRMNKQDSATLLENFQILKQVGRGTFGRVMLVRNSDQKLRKTVIFFTFKWFSATKPLPT
jgi:hypothetical protein